MLNEQFYDDLKEKIKILTERSKDSSHDYFHVLRVYDLAIKLQEKEGGDIEVIKAAALLHDLHQFFFEKYNSVKVGGEILKEAKNILNKLGFPEDKISDVLHCIEVHDNYNFTKEGNQAETIEAKIIQDADNLDGLGAIGIARTFAFGGKHSSPMWDGQKVNSEFYENENINRNSIQHFYEKLLKLRENMNTKTAKEMAKVKHEFTKEFIDQFIKEWEVA